MHSIGTWVLTAGVPIIPAFFLPVKQSSSEKLSISTNLAHALHSRYPLTFSSFEPACSKDITHIQGRTRNLVPVSVFRGPLNASIRDDTDGALDHKTLIDRRVTTRPQFKAYSDFLEHLFSAHILASSIAQSANIRALLIIVVMECRSCPSYRSSAAPSITT